MLNHPFVDVNKRTGFGELRTLFQPKPIKAVRPEGDEVRMLTDRRKRYVAADLGDCHSLVAAQVKLDGLGEPG